MIYLAEKLGTFELIKQIISSWDGVLVLDYDFCSRVCSQYKVTMSCPSFEPRQLGTCRVNKLVEYVVSVLALEFDV